MTERVQGLQHLLRAVAIKLHGDVEGLNSELLLQSATHLDALEAVASVALTIIKQVPHSKGRRRLAVKVDVNLLADLAGALDRADKDVYGHRV